MFRYFLISAIATSAVIAGSWGAIAQTPESFPVPVVTTQPVVKIDVPMAEPQSQWLGTATPVESDFVLKLDAASVERAYAAYLKSTPKSVTSRKVFERGLRRDALEGLYELFPDGVQPKVAQRIRIRIEYEYPPGKGKLVITWGRKN